MLNNFCTNLRTNEPRCTSCHTGYGWEDASFDFSDDTRVDCLVCHDTTGTYHKAPKDAGRVLKETATVHGKTLTPPDLGEVARNVGEPSRASCGSCHFNGGGGDGSKHGDLDSSLIDGPRSLDVHMSPEGGDMACQDCHVSSGHELAGGRYDMTARDPHGTGKPGMRRQAATCESCHGIDAHDDGSYVARTLNQHSDRVACQTCHIPKIARGGVQTKTWWDWSKAGRLARTAAASTKPTPTGGPATGPAGARSNGGRTTFLPTPGSTATCAIPSRPTRSIPTAWSRSTASAAGRTIRTRGSGRLKSCAASSPTTPKRDRMVLMHVFGQDDTAYWTNLDWKPAIETAMAAEGLPFSGEVGFVETKMYWPITHMVAPADQAVGCADCHSEDSRLAGLDSFYMPGRDAPAWLDRIGGLAVLATLLGVLGHAALRAFFRYRRAAR